MDPVRIPCLPLTQKGLKSATRQWLWEEENPFGLDHDMLRLPHVCPLPPSVDKISVREKKIELLISRHSCSLHVELLRIHLIHECLTYPYWRPVSLALLLPHY